MNGLTALSHRRTGRTGLSNAGWAYDNYPELKTLDAGSTIDLAALEGPGVITCFHITQHIAVFDGVLKFLDKGTSDENVSESAPLLRAVARGLILEVRYNGSPLPAVSCPLADFFADGCEGKSIFYSSLFVEKMPLSYNCYIPMPFEKNIHISLHNTTVYDCLSYSFIEYERLPEWDTTYQYLHCAWQSQHLQLTPDTVLRLIHIPGRGHLIGNQYSISTSEPVFKDFFFIMEGNVEHRIDGESRPSIDYLGTEDSFGFSWGFRQTFYGLRSGINYIQKTTLPIELSIFRFRDQNPITFEQSLDIRINWQNEFTLGKTNYQTSQRQLVWDAVNRGGAWVDYATTYYWYLDGG